ncbi:MAG: hypothetical protein RLW62_10690 [Gammaproteobacteria bacterium]
MTRLLLRGLLAWAFAIGLGVLAGRAVSDALLPAFALVTEGLSSEYAPLYAWSEEQPDMLVLRADLLTPAAVTRASGVRNGQAVTTGSNLTHMLVPPVIVIALIACWPLSGWRQHAVAAALAAPLAALAVLLTTPFLLAGKVEALLRAYAASAGVARDQSLVYQWMLMSEGGARWALPLLLALVAVTVAARSAPPAPLNDSRTSAPGASPEPRRTTPA